ncbi:hypothetical protein ABNL11_004975 [Klebsiella pneumoniae]|uniref:hypothetical protein n=1 Tax=Klebsiella pneumoniae TaxID=573 RepID=UPI0018A3EEE6|nr:hypothetical protein [Klebsiella pneumoniae]ELE4368156.1 hypothetical protein [Salmonella enterica]EIX9714750.1 hypothetical protein [Klebsiella pneumoniae]EMD7130165.1 hypothetical protein [Salmonella enterica]MDE8392910.1 hypothetical protein [Klebsiella pneumoniae]BBW89487.1 hypothetical protein THOKLE017_P30240 [Klebsiella pneumoniae]
MNLKAFSKLSPKFQAVKRTLATLPALLATHQAMAANDVSLPTSDSNWINKLIGWFQTIVDAVSGAGVLLIVFLSACAAVALWIVVPKNSGTAMGYMARAAAGGIVLFNIGLVIASLQS